VKLVHLVGFIIKKNCYAVRSHERKNTSIFQTSSYRT